jgi:hypothetical protein
MQNQPSTEDLAQLRIISPTDRRQFDQWAFDDEFCHDFLLHVFANQHQKDRAWAWKRAIDLYWREGKSRRQLAAELDRSLDAVKSLLTTIRKAAEKFILGGKVVKEPPEFRASRPAYALTAHVIRDSDILALAEGDKAARIFVEEYHRLSVATLLELTTLVEDDSPSAEPKRLIAALPITADAPTASDLFLAQVTPQICNTEKIEYAHHT